MKRFKFIIPMIAMVIALVAAFAQNSVANNATATRYFDAPSPCILCDEDGPDVCTATKTPVRCTCIVNKSGVTAYLNDDCDDLWRVID